jgi:hypothetical protein
MHIHKKGGCAVDYDLGFRGVTGGIAFFAGIPGESDRRTVLAEQK